MALYEFSAKRETDESLFPLRAFEARVSVDLDFGDMAIPEDARRRFALQTIRDIVEQATEQDLTALRMTGLRESHENSGTWVQPAGLDLRIVKSAHRIIKEVARRGESGRPVIAAELVRDGIVSAPTMSRLLRQDDESGRYLAPHILVTPLGRSKAIDLTPKGRLMASRIRAGSVPS